MTLMSAVLKHNPVFKHQPEGQVFVGTLFEFLFKLPSSQVSNCIIRIVQNQNDISGEVAPGVQVAAVPNGLLRPAGRAR